MCIYLTNSWIYIIMYKHVYHRKHYIMHSTDLTLKLLIENRHIIVILRLIHITGNRIAELIFSGELPDGELAAVVTASIGQALFVESELARLFVQQEYVSVETCTLWRSRTDVLRQSFPFRHIRSRNIAYQPVMPFTKFRILSAWSIGIYLNIRTWYRTQSCINIRNKS